MKKITRFFSNNKALAAIEFAVILPILLAIALGTIEYSRAYYYKMKAAKISGALADAITISTPYYKPDGNAVNTSTCDNFVLTENRLDAMVNNNITAMFAPLNSNRIFIRVSSVYRGYGNGATCTTPVVATDPTLPTSYKFAAGTNECPPLVSWQKSYSGGVNLPANPPASPIGAQGGVIDGTTNKLPATYIGNDTGNPVNDMFPGENIIVVETYIKFDSIISGGLSYIVPGLTSGFIQDIAYYSPRNYIVNGDGKIQGGLSKLKTGEC